VFYPDLVGRFRWPWGWRARGGGASAKLEGLTGVTRATTATEKDCQGPGGASASDHDGHWDAKDPQVRDVARLAA
jgi:hypothetical protein